MAARFGDITRACGGDGSRPSMSEVHVGPMTRRQA
jgi:hypothetical protein